MSSIALIMLLVGATQLERPGRHAISVVSYGITSTDNTPSSQPASSSAAVGDKPSADHGTLLPEPDVQLMRSDVFRASLATQTETLIEQANSDIAELRLTTPPGNNAWERLSAVAILDPHNDAVQRGLQQILSRYIQLAREAEYRGEVKLSKTYMRRAESVLFGSGKFSFSRQLDDHSVRAYLKR